MSITTCPDPGALRAALDGERPDIAAHLADCQSCQALSAAQAQDAAFAAASFADRLAIGEREADAALQRFRAQTVAPVALPQRRHYRDGVLRAAAVLVAVALVGGVLSTSSGRSAFASLLERFRAEQVTAVPVDFAAVDPSDLQALASLADIEGLEHVVNPQEVADLEAAAAIAGFAATPLDRTVLPPTAVGPTHVLAQAPQTVFITFLDKPEVPAHIRDATLRLKVPGAVVQAVAGPGDRPLVVRGEAGTLEVVVDAGPPLEVIREALLSLPGLPSETVAALRDIEDWQTTLPLPVPTDGIAWSETTVADRPALAFGDESGVGSVVLWHDGDRFVGVGGRLPLSQIRALAEGGG